ncbi:MAG: class I SAM-dependent methyltransferase [Methanobacteriota archaeon]
MKVSWSVDSTAKDFLWKPLDDALLRLADGLSRPLVLEIGGGDGNVTRPLARAGARIVVLDIDREALRRVPSESDAILADVLHLPFRRAAFHGIVARATLHHVPDRLDDALAEMDRVLKKDGRVVVQEPLGGNPIYGLARRLFPTSWHDPDERPLAWSGYADRLARRWRVDESSAHFLFTYLIPFLTARMGDGGPRRLAGLVRAVDALDRALLLALPRLSRLAAYIHVLAHKSPDQSSA